MRYRIMEVEQRKKQSPIARKNTQVTAPVERSVTPPLQAYLLSAQAEFGNRYVQRMVDRLKAEQDVREQAHPGLEITKDGERENRTGLPDQLKLSIEQYSGYLLDDVRVHYSSPKPAELQALAYTQGTEIHIAPGQERHLPHEAWHVVQQKQGRVKPTQQTAGRLEINDDETLEKEADALGGEIIQHRIKGDKTSGELSASECGSVNEKKAAFSSSSQSGNIAQFRFTLALEGMTVEKLREILPSYGITGDDVIRIEERFDSLKKEALPIVSIPQLIERVLGRTQNKEAVSAQVKEDIINRAGEGTTFASEVVTLYRGDSRTPDEIRKAGGFFGREHALITIEHARQIMRDWQNSTPKQKLDKAQEWKSQTKGKTEIVPYVATGKESQKGGHEYRIDVPLKFIAQPGDAAFTPKLGCDQWPLESATIMAIKMHGDEVIFLTGIPWYYITLP